MPAIPPLYLPKRIWNFPGAYVVIAMTAVATSAAVYSAVHFIKDSPDFNWRKDLRADEEQESEWLRERAQQNQNSIYRKLASLRDRTVPGGPDGQMKDTRIWRI
ncbi:hypothetical protein D9Q98_006137 [Chlorella vulgaris]|uniref:Uncharacterized protein n=1 Tax=Chlorella vulgaris TaxID=3077 RepID=A0A9D4TX28_CHLVU|nr:hypothetical protein D9Q98_006137 [Chlorella vulgaris]